MCRFFFLRNSIFITSFFPLFNVRSIEVVLFFSWNLFKSILLPLNVCRFSNILPFQALLKGFSQTFPCIKKYSGAIESNLGCHLIKWGFLCCYSVKHCKYIQFLTLQFLCTIVILTGYLISKVYIFNGWYDNDTDL